MRSSVVGPAGSRLFGPACPGTDGEGCCARGRAEKPKEKAEKTFGPFAGTVLDSADKAVAGAKVWLLRGDYLGGFAAVAEATADGKGHFKIGAMKWNSSPDNPLSTEFIARDSQGRIGGQDRHYRPASESNRQNPFAGIGITLQEVKEYRSRLTDAAGRPIAKATIRPNVWTYQHEEDGRHTQDLIFFSDDLGRELTAVTGGDGRFLLHGMPRVGKIGVQIDSRDFGKPRASLNLEQSVTVALARPGNIRGSTVCDKDREAVAGMRIRMYLAAAVRGDRSDSFVYYVGNGITQKDGSFLFADVPPGTYTLEPRLPAFSPYYVANVRPVKVKSGETASVSWR